MYKKCKVIMLPTNDKTDLLKYHFESYGLGYNISKNRKMYSGDFYQHLYIVSDEEIKVGDYFYNTNIISCVGKEHLYQLRYANGLFSKYCKKIIATTDTSLKLPQIPQDFIKLYCEKGGIDEVDVRYEEVGICKEHNSSCGAHCNYRGIHKEVILFRNFNVIEIKTIKDIYTREEVLILINKAIKENSLHCYTEFKKEHIANTWIKKNI